ncbi:hypothetical protein C2S51_029500 [Perilla frutescens var. frutescens]|nr:hypothetical protein C2S51_029500 [Perilla frutescens var. frutescens]
MVVLQPSRSRDLDKLLLQPCHLVGPSFEPGPEQSPVTMSFYGLLHAEKWFSPYPPCRLEDVGKRKAEVAAKRVNGTFMMKLGFVFVSDYQEYDSDDNPREETVTPMVDGGKTPRTAAHCIEYAHLIKWNEVHGGESFDPDNPEDMQWVYSESVKRAELFGIPWTWSYMFSHTGYFKGMYNLYRASQTMFNGENLLADARNYSAKFLHQKRLDNAIVDKWIITKDLPGEVGYALDVPFYASLPRLEARFFLEQYGGDDDVWIGKTLYRMPYVNCDTYLEMAKLDYKNCQDLHQLEWKSIQKWYRDNNLGEFGLSERSLLLAFYIAASSAFEPEKSSERLAWAKTAVLAETIASQQLSDEQKCEFADEFECSNMLKHENGRRYETRLAEIVINTVSQLSSEILVTQGREIHQHLSTEWQKWLKTWEEGSDLGEAEARLLLQTLHLSSGLDEPTFSHPKYHQLVEATSKVCHEL